MFGYERHKNKEDNRPCKYLEQTQMSVESITKSLNETTMRVADIERRLQDDNLRFEKTDSKIGRFEEKLNTLTSTVESIDHKTDELIQKPSKRYEAIS